MTTLQTLPPELLQQILTHLPPSTLQQTHLTSRLLRTHSFPLLFPLSAISHWLSYKLSHASIISIAEDYCGRPAVMWSPWATGPDGPVERTWMEICWKVVVGSVVPGGESEEGMGEKERMVLTPGNFAELSGQEDMCENRLRTAQNRYLTWKSYTEKREGVVGSGCG